jgi:hypothetical protein
MLAAPGGSIRAIPASNRQTSSKPDPAGQAAKSAQE